MSDVTLFAHMDTAVQAVSMGALLLLICVIVIEQGPNLVSRLKHGRPGRAGSDALFGRKS